LGEHLIKAGSGREALEYLLTTDIAVILLDVHMPGLDGLTAARTYSFLLGVPGTL
jgi:CheY-like chemotaxis protein